jgi:hypothetical protein
LMNTCIRIIWLLCSLKSSGQITHEAIKILQALGVN